jgi:septal ring factor EnvC (AmiA/AmiB activator)
MNSPTRPKSIYELSPGPEQSVVSGENPGDPRALPRMDAFTRFGSVHEIAFAVAELERGREAQQREIEGQQRTIESQQREIDRLRDFLSNLALSLAELERGREAQQREIEGQQRTIESQQREIDQLRDSVSNLALFLAAQARGAADQWGALLPAPPKN